MFNTIKKDFQTYDHKLEWGFIALSIYRYGRWRYTIKSKAVRMPFSLIYKVLFHYIKGKGIELPCEIDIGKNFRIDHQGGIVISGYCSFGDNCVVRNGVTAGIAHIGEQEAPTFGNNVDIGAGAKILGNVRIGNNVDIGANAVVLQDVPDNSIAVGVPARIINKALRVNNLRLGSVL